jgi:hypothetical protein
LSPQPSVFKVKGSHLPLDDEATHLGIHHSAVTKKNLNGTRVAKNIKAARGALYSLFGAGLHGKNGLTPPLCKHLWQVYIMTILTYGTETWQLSTTKVEPMERFQRKSLRALQSLPDSTANAATCGLLGLLPVLQTIEGKALNLLVAVLQAPNSKEYQLAVRQSALKDDKSNSWFCHIQNLLHKYHLPTIHSLLESTPTRNRWKATVKSAIHHHWQLHCRRELGLRSSLKYIPESSLAPDHVAPVWESIKDNPREAFKAQVKAKILTGTYRLQALRARFNQHEVDPTCLLCGEGPEDRLHFLLKCPVLEISRKPHMQDMLRTLEEFSHGAVTRSCDDTVLMHTLLDATHPSVPQVIRENKGAVERLECVSRNLIFSIHRERWLVLNPQSVVTVPQGKPGAPDRRNLH